MVSKEIEEAILKTYSGWKNKYELVKVADMSNERLRKLYGRGLRTGGVCHTMEMEKFEGDAKQELEGLVTHVDEVMAEIKEGNKTSALAHIKAGLILYVNIIKKNFPDVYDKHKEVLTWR